MGSVVVCPLCLSIFVYSMEIGEECPECEVGELVSWEDHIITMSTSFLESFNLFRGSDDQ